LDNKKISNNATVTIMLTNNATNYDSIVINNPDANKINIIGNCNSGPCTIQFKSGANGIVADKGNTLGLLDNFNLIGQKTPSTNGILAIQKSSIICGSHITVQQFENGLQAIYGSYIAAPYVVSQYNLKNGITVFNGSTAYVPHANVNHNGDKGIIAWGTSNIEATDAIAQYNYDGIFSDGNSLIDARRSVADNNDHWGMRASLGAVIGAENTRASNNASSGFEAIFNALIFAPSATAQNNNPNVNEEQQGQVWGVQVNQAKK